MYGKIQMNDEKINNLYYQSVIKIQFFQEYIVMIGHPGKERMLSLVRERFYWPACTVRLYKC